MSSIASSAVFNCGEKPPSSPTEVLKFLSLRRFFNSWKISTPHLKADSKLLNPRGWIINSWKSIPLSAWAPPFRIFNIGTGRVGVLLALKASLYKECICW